MQTFKDTALKVLVLENFSTDSFLTTVYFIVSTTVLCNYKNVILILESGFLKSYISILV